ncbi:MAG TPA: DNA primase, partial [Halanaerobiales bacterium]|nr:DNA primase [Halanaerobiales bacterium]
MSVSNNHIIEEIKSSIDIVNIISEYVELKRTGKNYKGLCPFHQEKTPSFNVNPERQFFYCFGCGEGGDVFSFLMKIDNITFQEALKILARRSGITLPDYTDRERRIGEQREKVFAINNFVAKYYNYILTNSKAGEKAVDYLDRRGFSAEDIHKFKLGYAPQGWTTLLNFLKSRNYTTEELLKAGLIVKGRNNKLYDRFRERIIFPIFNICGEVLAFGGRIINTTEKNIPKYLNSPETVIYRKGETLYGLNWACDVIRKTGEVIIMEGYTDILTAHCHGLCNAVASLGTALTYKQARLLKRYASMVYIAYDADSAGEQATIRGLDVLKKSGLDVKVINLPGQMDPDDFIQREGKDGFDTEKEKALTLMEFKLQKVIGDTDYS